MRKRLKGEKVLKNLSVFFLSVTLVFTSVWTPVVQAENTKIDYVALGDSVASGQTPYLEKVGRGFTDMISEALTNEDMLSTFNKDFAKSGETSVGLLETLKRPEVQQSLREAELVTIISGANDFIDEFYNPDSKEITADMGRAIELLNSVANNLTSSIKTVKSLNQEAEIYLFGYYFPLPHYPNGSTKSQLETAFRIVNTRLAMIAEEEGVHFVEVASTFDGSGKQYLENPQDIHPNEVGYQVIADQFFLKYPIAINNKFPNPTGLWGQKIEKAEQVAASKKWTVTLNSDLNEESIKDSVFVVKDGTQLIEVEKEISKDNPNQLVITPPEAGYTVGSYQLMITNDLKSSVGKSLKTNVLMNFTVK